MEAAGDFHHEITNDPAPEADGVLDHATAFDTAVDVFNPHASLREGTIVGFLFRRQDAPAGLFGGLEQGDAVEIKGQKSQVLQQMAVRRQGIGAVVRNPLVMHATFKRGA